LTEIKELKELLHLLELRGFDSIKIGKEGDSEKLLTE